MIQPMKFEGMLKDLELYFESSYNSTQKEKLYELFRYVEPWVMEGAVAYLAETFKPYPGHRLPIGVDFTDAIKEASKGEPSARIEELDEGCDECGGIGGKIEPTMHLGITYDTVFPCEHCRKGRVFKRNFDAVQSGRGVLRK